jgi:hypothetical protein
MTDSLNINVVKELINGIEAIDINKNNYKQKLKNVVI